MDELKDFINNNEMADLVSMAGDSAVKNRQENRDKAEKLAETAKEDSQKRLSDKEILLGEKQTELNDKRQSI